MFHFTNQTIWNVYIFPASDGQPPTDVRASAGRSFLRTHQRWETDGGPVQDACWGIASSKSPVLIFVTKGSTQVRKGCSFEWL